MADKGTSLEEIKKENVDLVGFILFVECIADHYIHYIDFIELGGRC